MNQPDHVMECFRVLRQHGCTGYLVGGCVRDLLLGRTPEDYDMASDALPEEVMAMFPHTAPTGLKHGTVTVVLDGGTVELTTFRTEAGYADGRHPDGVRFAARPEEDLSRRDFTINAMAMGEDGALLDCFGGREDLAAGLIRCVGDPDRRFSEDALRMLRAVRFSAQLGFRLEDETRAALLRNAPLCRRLSAERVKKEVEKTLCAPDPERAEELLSAGLLDGWLDGSAAGLSLKGLSGLPNAPLHRWAGFCACLSAAGAISDGGALLRRMKAGRALLLPLQRGDALWRSAPPATPGVWRRLAAEQGQDAVTAACAMWEVSGVACRSAFDAARSACDCWSTGDLKLTGGDLQRMGYTGRTIGQAQRYLLDYVLEFPDLNDREELEVLLSGWRG